MKQINGSLIELTSGYSLAYRSTLSRLARLVPFADAVLSTALPRGGLQITQPRGTDAVRMRLYVRERHLIDIVAWEAIRYGLPLRLSDLLHPGPGAPTSEAVKTTAASFQARFLRPSGFAHYMAVPLGGPTLEGFPGALHLFRTGRTGDFTTDELEQLREVGRDFDEAIALTHQERMGRREGVPRHPHRQLAFSRGQGLIFPSSVPETFDEVLVRNLSAVVEERLSHFQAQRGQSDRRDGDLAACDPARDGRQPRGRMEAAEGDGDGDEEGDGVEGAKLAVAEEEDLQLTGSNADRLLIPGESGDNWTFRLALFETFPAINEGREGPVAVVSLQPECEAWSTLRPSDFAADDEIARLIPALQFMQENYARGLSLGEIARTVHLSPFHFHRRFTDLLGITPKHFLFDCQIGEAKRLLTEGTGSLAEVARQTGFAHQSHFTSRFKQATNLTPTKWRRLMAMAR